MHDLHQPCSAKHTHTAEQGKTHQLQMARREVGIDYSSSLCALCKQLVLLRIHIILQLYESALLLLRLPLLSLPLLLLLWLLFELRHGPRRQRYECVIVRADGRVVLRAHEEVVGVRLEVRRFVQRCLRGGPEKKEGVRKMLLRTDEWMRGGGGTMCLEAGWRREGEGRMKKETVNPHEAS